MRKIASISLVILVLGFSVPAAAAPEPAAKASTEKLPEAFSPARCKTGSKDYVYWAAGDQVFRFKYNPEEPIYLTADAEKAAPNLRAKGPPASAPHPAEPQGCYGNPLRLGPVPYMRTFDQELFRNITGRRLDVDTAAQHGYFSIRNNQRDSNMGGLAKKWFLENKNHWQRASGIYESVRQTGMDRNDYSTSHVFKIEKTSLPKHPQVQAVYFVSSHDAATNNTKTANAIESEFDLFGNLRIATSLRLLPEEIDFLLPYYSGLINYVLQAHVPSYRWATNR